MVGTDCKALTEMLTNNHISAATAMYTYKIILHWLCISNKDIQLKSNANFDLRKVDVDAKAKGLLSTLLCCSNRMEDKQNQRL